MFYLKTKTDLKHSLFKSNFRQQKKPSSIKGRKLAVPPFFPHQKGSLKLTTEIAVFDYFNNFTKETQKLPSRYQT